MWNTTRLITSGMLVFFLSGLIGGPVLNAQEQEAAGLVQAVNVAERAFDRDVQYQAVRRFTIDGIRSADANFAIGAQILVGRNPTGSLAGREGQVARWNAQGWAFAQPTPGDQIFDAESGEQYLFTGERLLFDGLWIDSEWRRLTSERPKWRGGAVLTSSSTLTANDHGRWFVVSAERDGTTITLPNPFLGELDGMGMELIVEPEDGASGSARLVVAGGVALMTPDGHQTFEFELPRGTGRSHVYRLVAGNLVSGAAWYITKDL